VALDQPMTRKLLTHEVIAKFQKAQDFFGEAEDKKEV